MKLEDCSKEELIYFLKRNAFIDTDRLEFDVLMYRSEAAAKKASHERTCAIKAFGEYAEVMRPYEGKPIIDIPDSVFKKARSPFNRYKQHTEAAARYDKQYDKIQKQINRNLASRD